MIAYVDSSVVLRVLFGEADVLEEWGEIVEAYSSRLLAIEVLRVIDRCRLEGRIDDEAVALVNVELRSLVRSISIVSLSEPILRRAGAAMPTVLGTLDSIHLATALELAETLERPLVLATHDLQLARAARASGLDVRGAPAR